jgi:5-methylcytosine-specific restriction endonuclease McrA
MDLFESQNGICVYTGRVLTIGLDASVDHIKPKSVYPELRHDIKNMQFISLRANRAKLTLSHQEFLELCHDVVNYAAMH